VSRPALVRGALFVAALLLVLYAASRLASRETPAPVADPAVAAPQGEERLPDGSDEDAPSDVMRHLHVLIYFPATEGDGLSGEPREIFLTKAPGDRAKQVLAELIAGPTQPTSLRALPHGTLLRQVYVLDDGTAWVDFSRDLRVGLGGGSAGELFAVYAIVNSVALNIPEIHRVGILIDGEPVETLNGHVDLRRPLPPDTSVIVQTAAAGASAGPD
jgi:spore germination protein GerM